MVGIRHMAQWARAVLAMLVVMASVVAPGAGAQATPCHDQPGQRHAMPLEQPSGPAIHPKDQGAQGHVPADLKNCCGTVCGISLAVIGKEKPTLLQRLTALSRLEWSDQAGNSVVFPPALGPPRPTV